MPDKITLFQKNLEYLHRDEKSIIRGIRDTLLHEIAHHFGFSEEEIRETEREIRKRPKHS